MCPLQSLFYSLYPVATRLDYSNTPYMGLSVSATCTKCSYLLTYNKKFAYTLLPALHWLPVHFWILFKILCFAFKTINGCDAILCWELLHPYTASWSSDQLLLKVPKSKQKLWGHQAFPVAATKLWNKLLLHIRQTSPLSDFKTFLTMYLFVFCF